MKHIKAFLFHPFFQGTFLFTVLSFASNILNYFFNLMIARVVTVSQYGEYASALSYLMIFSVPFGALSLILIRRIGGVSQKEKNGYIKALQQTLFSYVLKHIGEIAIGTICIGCLLFFFSNMSLASIIFIFSLFFVTFFFTIYMAIYQAEKKFLLAGGYLCVLALTKVMGGGIAGVFQFHLYFLYAVIVCSYFFVIAFSHFDLSRRTVEKLPKFPTPHIFLLMKKKEFYLPVLSFLGLVAMTNLDIMIVKRYFSSDDAGLYAALSLLGRIILYVSLPLTTVAFSYFTGSETKDSGHKVLWMSLGVLVTIGVVSIAGYTLLPNLVVHTIFGDKYLSIVPLVWLTSFFGVMYSLATLMGQYWVSQHHHISVLSLIIAVIQGILLLLFHSSFFSVLIISIICSSILFFVYVSALILSQRYTHATRF